METSRVDGVRKATGRRFVTMNSHRLPRSRRATQQHDEAVAIRYGSIKQPRPFGMIGQVEERRAELHELRLLFSREDNIFEMSCWCVEFRTFHQFINFRIQAYDKI